jgi:hypothetical protein
MEEMEDTVEGLTEHVAGVEGLAGQPGGLQVLGPPGVVADNVRRLGGGAGEQGQEHDAGDQSAVGCSTASSLSCHCYLQINRLNQEL